MTTGPPANIRISRRSRCPDLAPPAAYAALGPAARGREAED